MINLLPDDLRKQIKTQQHNNILAKSLLVLLIAIIILLGAHYYLNSLNDSQQTQTTNQEPKLTDAEKDIAKQSARFSSALNAIQTSNRGYQISDYALDITNRLPEDVIIKQLIINPDDINNRQLKITCFSKDPAHFANLESAFQDSDLIDSIQISTTAEIENEATPYSTELTLQLKGDDVETQNPQKK